MRSTLGSLPGSSSGRHTWRSFAPVAVAFWSLVVLVVASADIWRGREVTHALLPYGCMYLAGLVGIAVGALRLKQREHQHLTAVEALRNAKDELESRVEERTAELKRANEGLLLEIAERRLAEEALRQSESRYRDLVENAPLGIVSFDFGGHITGANSAFLAAIDGPSPLWAHTINVLTYPPFLDAGWADDFKQCLTQLDPVVSERSFLSERGRELVVRLFVAVLKDKDGNVSGAQALVDDITARKQSRELLRVSERKFRSLFEVATDFIHIIDSRGIILQTNPAAVESLGCGEHELLSRPLSAFLTPASRELFGEQCRRGLERFSQRLELELVCKDGLILTVDCSCAAIRDNDGEITSFVLYQRDITKRKRVEETIEHQNRFLHLVLESLTHPFYVIDAEQYEVILANSAAKNDFLSGPWTCYGLTHGRSEPCNTRDHPCPVAEVKLTGKPVTVEHVHYDKDGSPRNFEVHAYPLFDADGTLGQVIEYTLDITERRKVEEALKESEAKMRQLIESAPIGIYVAQSGCFQYVNPALVTMFGYGHEEEIINRPLATLMVPEDMDALKRSSRELIEGRSSSRFHEITGVRKDDSHFRATVWMTRIEHEESPAVFGFVTDVSEERRLRAHLLRVQKMDAIGTLSGGIAHDFNNLLQAIHGYAELALLGLTGADRCYSELQVILSAARRGGDLTQGLLTFSRQMESRRKPLDLNHEVQDVTRLLARTITKMIKIQLRLGEDLKIINADPVQVQQVIMNLALNARDAMPDGGSLIIETKNVVLSGKYCISHLGIQPGDYVHLSLTDTGYGMDRETEERMFEPFFTTKERGKGSGLGLSIVYGIVTGHDGSIVCYTEPGVGTTFHVYWPVIEAPPQAAEPHPLPTTAGGDETILIVDDEAWIRDLGTEILTRFGYRVITAVNGHEGLALYRSAAAPIDLVILDLMMPELSGWECLKELRSIDPGVRVIIASGYSADGSLEHTRAEGARAFIRKPYEAGRLLELVRTVLDQG